MYISKVELSDSGSGENEWALRLERPDRAKSEPRSYLGRSSEPTSTLGARRGGLERANIASGSAFSHSNELLERSKDDLGSILVDLSSILDPQRVVSDGFSTLFRCVRARAG